MLYIIETRKTVGSYKTVTVTQSLNKAIELFEKIKSENNFGCGYHEVDKLTSSQKRENPDVIMYAKVGKSHSNFAVRVREVKEE